MSQANAPIQGIDFHLLNSALLKFGVTPGGAYEFLQGLPVSSQADRNALHLALLGLTTAAAGRATPDVIGLKYEGIDGSLPPKAEADLVVIAIIATLAAILFPVFSQRR